MNDKFFDLKKDKQDKIINAALKIFGTESYKRASTDEVVKEAGISKGLLFHYFESKKGLYEFLFDYSARFMAMELNSAISSSDSDPFRIFGKMVKAEASIMGNYPYMGAFLRRSRNETDTELLDIQQDGRASLAEIEAKNRNQMNFSSIRKVDEDTLVEMIQLMLDSIRLNTEGDATLFGTKARACLDALEKMAE